MSGTKILRVKKTNMYDVFMGDGWKNHSRIYYDNGRVSLVNGNKLSRIKFIEISKEIGANGSVTLKGAK